MFDQALKLHGVFDIFINNVKSFNANNCIKMIDINIVSIKKQAKFELCLLLRTIVHEMYV